MTDIGERLISWYLVSKRNLPWRETRDPYLIWLSEIILQQTRVDQGLNYFLKFSETFPTVSDLADASEQEVLKMWQGLGYYSRARNLLEAAIQVSTEHGGVFPKTYKEVLKLKGVGPYTAAAISSFAYKLPHAVVDGNVNRVIARLFDLNFPVDSNQGKKKVQEIADHILSKDHPDLFNQGIMELGAMVCTPHNPKCDTCPIGLHCLSRTNSTIAERPLKLPKRKPVERILHYLVLDDGGSLILSLRTQKDIWKGLWDFPQLDINIASNPDQLKSSINSLFPKIQLKATPIAPSKHYKHILTHQHIKAYFWVVQSESNFIDNSIYLRVPKSDLESVAVPRLIQKYLIDSSFINDEKN